MKRLNRRDLSSYLMMFLFLSMIRLSWAEDVPTGRRSDRTGKNPVENAIPWRVNVVLPTDLSVTVTPGSNPTSTGTPLGYSVLVSNLGPNGANNVQVTINVPDNSSFLGLSSPSGWSCGIPGVGDGGSAICTHSLLASGGSATFLFTVTVGCNLPNGGALLQSSSVTFTGTDSNPANNTSNTIVNVANPAMISPTSQSFGSAGGTGTVSVTYSYSCNWNAFSNSSFATITSGLSGLGSAVVGYLVAANPTISPRTGTLTIAGMTFTVNQDAGNPSTTQTHLILNPGGATSSSTLGIADTVQAGYATVTMNASKSAVDGRNEIINSSLYGTAVFSLSQNGTVVSEAGVPASPPLYFSRLFVDYRLNLQGKDDREDAGVISVNTGFAVVNFGLFPANLTFSLKDAQGIELSTGHATIPVSAHRAIFIDQLNQLAPDFRIPAGFGTTILFATLEIRSNQLVSVLPLRLTTNQRGETLLTTAPIADLTAQLTSAPFYFPQVVDGGGYQTSIFLINTTTTVQTGTLSFLNNTGGPLQVHRVGDPPGASSLFNYSIPAAGLFVFMTDGMPNTVNAGSAQLQPDFLSSAPFGAAVFSYTANGIRVTESGVPAVLPTTHARIYIDGASGHNTGLAIAAPNATPLHLQLSAFQTDGISPAGSGTVDLGGNGHDARFANQFLSLPTGFTGLLDIYSPLPFVAATLRSLTNSRGDFLLTMFPVADAIQPAPFPIVFPQIVDGGGYRTQFILLSTAGGANAILSYFGDDGSPIPLGKTAESQQK